MIGFSATRRSTEVVLNYARMKPGDAGLLFEPSRVKGTPGARPDSFPDLTWSVSGEGNLNGVYLVGSNDGANWFSAHATDGEVARSQGGTQHIDGRQYRFFRPVVDESADQAMSANVEIHLTDRG